jgi:hypothetical protein
MRDKKRQTKEEPREVELGHKAKVSTNRSVYVHARLKRGVLAQTDESVTLNNFFDEA